MNDPVNFEIINAKVGHRRLSPKNNSFLYRVFYVKIPILNTPPSSPLRLFSINKWNVFSVMTRDHGAKNNTTSWYEFIMRELHQAKIPLHDTDSIFLCCFPRIFGYAFNPISYWLIVDKNQHLRAVLCEVRNTFKENHNYLLAKKDHGVISANDILVSEKKLYVSPFNKVEGKYEFSFSLSSKEFKSIINYYDATDEQILNTYVGGTIEKLTDPRILKALLLYPLMTIIVVVRIHWQAAKLYFKKVSPTLKTKPKDFKNNRTTISKTTKR